MSLKQRTILKLANEGKSYSEICKTLKINKSNLHTTVYQMRKKGMILEQHKTKHLITNAQRNVLYYYYMEKVPVPKIAQRMKIKVQTVLNHASAGFSRLGLTTPGVDRIEALKSILGQRSASMDDPFFN